MSKLSDFMPAEETIETGLVQGQVPKKLRADVKKKMKAHNEKQPKNKHTWNKIIEAGLRMYAAENP